ncbi:MAG: peptide/nickel transport system permease protein [Solirubrobacteraceae bacterium]
MIRFVLARVGGALATVAISSVVVFLLVRLVPGDPIGALIGGQNIDPKLAASLRSYYGLNEPITSQFADWVSHLLHGDFGQSIILHSPVIDELSQRVPRTLYLMAGGVLTGLLIAVPAGIVSAIWRGRLIDGLTTTVTSVLLSIPQFFLAVLLILLFSVTWHLLPAAGYVDPSVDFVGSLEATILPWLAIGLPMSAFVARVLRSSMLETLDQDYIRTARSRGLREARIVIGHALRNAAIPTVTVIGLQIGYLMGGAIVVEVVFAYPGMGQLLVDAITRRDYPVVQGAVLFFAVAFVFVNLCTDLAYMVIDPRTRTR